MSRENVEVVKEFSQLFAAGDRDSWREYFDPDLIWDASASGLPQAGVYRGHDGVEQFFRDWLGAWRDYEVEYTEEATTSAGESDGDSEDSKDAGPESSGDDETSAESNGNGNGGSRASSNGQGDPAELEETRRERAERRQQRRS